MQILDLLKHVSDCHCCQQTLSTKWLLEFFQRCIVWSFRTSFLDDVDFATESCIDAKTAKTNELIFDDATRLDEEQNRFVWRRHRYDSWYLELIKRYIVKQVSFVWVLRQKRESNALTTNIWIHLMSSLTFHRCLRFFISHCDLVDSISM